MKKFLSILLALLMMMSAVSAFAEETAELVPYAAADSGLSFDSFMLPLPSAGLSILFPADMQIQDLAELQKTNPNAAWAAANSTLFVELDATTIDPATTLDAMVEELNKQEGYTAAKSDLNGMEAIALQATTDGGTCVGALFIGTDGYFYQFYFYYQDDAGLALANEMIGTLKPYTADAPAA
ncbi:MAG: hypothetical protein RSC91_04835 [Clostridia bacterium]